MRKNNILRAILLGTILFSSSVYCLDEFIVSTTELNRVVFPEPFVEIIFPPKTPLEREPIKLNNDRIIILDFKKEASKPFVATINLKSGETFDLKFIPKKNIEPQVWRYKNAPDVLTTRETLTGRSSDKWCVDLLNSLLKNQIPSGYMLSGIERESVLALGEHIKAIPINKYKGTSSVIVEYRIESTKQLNVEPSEFYQAGENISHIFIDGDLVFPKAPLIMYIFKGI